MDVCKNVCVHVRMCMCGCMYVCLYYVRMNIHVYARYMHVHTCI